MGYTENDVQKEIHAFKKGIGQRNPGKLENLTKVSDS